MTTRTCKQNVEIIIKNKRVQFLDRQLAVGKTLKQKTLPFIEIIYVNDLNKL